MNIENELIQNIQKLHTTELGAMRIRKNLSLETESVVDWCRNQIESAGASIIRRGKNWYINGNGCMITVHAYSFTIITAQKENTNHEKQFNQNGSI